MIESQHSEDKPSASTPNAARSRLSHPEGLGDMLLYRINRLRAVGGGIVLRYCEGHFGVTRREWVLIALLCDSESLTSSDLAQRAELTKSATSKAIGTLRAKGLVSRGSLRGDQRFAQLTLTDTGRALYEKILPVVDSVNRDLMQGLHGDEIVLLDRMLERMEAQATAMAEALPSMPKADRRRGGAQRHVDLPNPSSTWTGFDRS